MAVVSPSELKRGMVLMVDNSPQVVEDLRVSGAAQTRHKTHVRFRNLITHKLVERVVADNERFPVADSGTTQVSFSYRQGDQFVFMDEQSYDELILTIDDLEDKADWMKEGEPYTGILFEGTLVDIVVPSQMVLTISDTGPIQKGSASDSSWKDAVLETGVKITVPLFVGTGDRVRVDTINRKYLSREQAD